MVSRHLAFSVQVVTGRCTGCGWCVAACPLDLLSLQPQGWRKFALVEREQLCTGCLKCQNRCLFGAIRVAPRAVQ